MMNCFHVSIVWAGTGKPAEQLKGILDLADDWLAMGNSLFIVFSSDSLYDWQQRFYAVIGTNDYVFISQIKDVQQDTAGFMTGNYWRWLRKDRRPLTIASSTLPVPQFLPPGTR